MTDSFAALAALSRIECAERALALAAFYERWKGDKLVIDKWFGLQASAPLPRALDDTRTLLLDPCFDPNSPAKVRALVGQFAANRVQFHAGGGAGYHFVADKILEVEKFNPKVAAGLATAFREYRRVDAHRQDLMRIQLERILSEPNLARAVYEIVSKTLREDTDPEGD